MNTTSLQHNISLLLVRITLSVVVAAHGVQKLFGWFGGYGYSGTMSFFTDTIGIPYAMGVAIILGETLGMIALLLGLLGRYMAAGVIAIMVGAVVTWHAQYGFYMNWDGVMKGEGYEFHLLAIALASVVVINGSGMYSLDHLLTRKLQAKKAHTSLA